MEYENGLVINNYGEQGIRNLMIPKTRRLFKKVYK